jgi:hypothetical protein
MRPPGIPPPARAHIYGAALVSGIVLTAFSSGYGYHRDELYFRMLPNAWGYVDQPPLTPLLAHAFSAAFTDATWAIRIPATLATMASVVVIGLLAREFGGGRRAQALAAWGYASAAIPLIMGHALLTSTIDLPVWPAIALCIVRAIRRVEPRWWLAAGLLTGLSMYNKLLVAALLVSLAVALALVGPRRLLVSRAVLGAAAIAVLVGLPNLLYQAAHGWPQFAMGQALARNNATSVRIMMWPFLILMLGPPLVGLWIGGLRWLWRQRELRFLAVAFPVLLVFVFVMGAQFYYPLGLQDVLFAAGCASAEPLLYRGNGWRRAAIAGVAVNAAVSLVLALPLVPLHSLANTPIADINQVARDSVGWPTYVAEIAAVYREIPATDRAHAIVYATNYGEAGAVDRYGPADGLPPPFSGQNALHDLPPPPANATIVVFVGGQYPSSRDLFATCAVRARLDNHLGVDTEEQGEPVALCRRPLGGWRTAWPQLRHLD